MSQCLKSWSHIYIWYLYFVIINLVGVLAPNVARPSAATLMTTKSYMFSMKFHRLAAIPNHLYWSDDFIQNCPGDLQKLQTLWVNSLLPNDVIWWNRSGSTLAQVMACCLMAPSHYLNQYWLNTSKVLWHSSDGNFTRDTSATNH